MRVSTVSLHVPQPESFIALALFSFFSLLYSRFTAGALSVYMQDLHLAVVLHGRLGAWATGPAGTTLSGARLARRLWLDNAKERRSQQQQYESPDLAPQSTIGGFARFVHSSFDKYVVQANVAAGVRVSVFMHSWHRELQELLDALYQPKASRHDRPIHFAESVRSQHLSMKRSLSLMHRADETQFSLVLICRYDVLWFSPLLVSRLMSAPLWLPRWCRSAASNSLEARAACGLADEHGKAYRLSPMSARSILGASSAAAGQEDALDALTVLDWWLVASPTCACPCL